MARSTIRYSPSTCSASFDRACRLSRVRAFTAFFVPPSSVSAACFFFALPFWLPRPVDGRHQLLLGEWAYQMSIVRICANCAMASR